MVEGQVEEQRLARDWLEVRRKRDEIGLLAEEGWVKMEGVQTLRERLRKDKEGQMSLTEGLNVDNVYINAE